VVTDSAEGTLKEIRIEHEAVADKIAGALSTNEARRRGRFRCDRRETRSLQKKHPAVASASRDADDLASQMEARIKTLQTNANEATRKSMSTEAQELRVRKLLGKHKSVVLDDHRTAEKGFAAYGLCIDETKAAAITQKKFRRNQNGCLSTFED